MDGRAYEPREGCDRLLQAFANLPAAAGFIPGMTLTAESKVGSRSILSYFLWPVLRGIDGSLQEP